MKPLCFLCILIFTTVIYRKPNFTGRNNDFIFYPFKHKTNIIKTLLLKNSKILFYYNNIYMKLDLLHIFWQILILNIIH